MDFTREPILETLISPKEGHQLLVRSSKSGSADSYHVDALEVVSFGRALFYRSVEKPQAFLVPASDYEVLEVKEPRVVLKAAVHEKNIKIGGGRDAAMRPSTREAPAIEPVTVEEEVTASSENETESASQPPLEQRRRDRHRRRRRGGRSGAEEQPWTPPAAAPDQEVMKSPTLIPPPTTLISQTISRYKEQQTPAPEQPLVRPQQESGTFLPHEIHQEPPAPSSGSVEMPPILQRMSSELPAAYRTPVLGEHDSYFF